jgi:selenocysteine-specific elongation factor
LETKPFLLIFSGIPSSGKTTIAQRLGLELEEKHGIPAIVIGSDQFRSMIPLHSRRFDPEREPFVKELTLSAITQALKRGYVVINDDMNYYVSMRKELSQLAKSAGAGFAVIHFDTSLRDALQWNEARGKPIPQQLIEEIYNKLEEPGKEYRWDRPIVRVDPSSTKIEEITRILVDNTLHAMERWGRPIKLAPPRHPYEDVDRATRQALGELVKRFKSLDSLDQLSAIRRDILRKARHGSITANEACRIFSESVQKLLESRPLKASGSPVVHVGLFGHVDHGKTTLAAALTEKPSTASLDRLPEAQRRGMTVDIGFSAFKLGEYLVSLVDLPGHHSLVRQATAGASIVDAAIMVVAADEGPQPQTLEHLSALRHLDVKRMVVAVTKSDLVTSERLAETISRIRKMLPDKYSRSPIVPVSAVKGLGIRELKEELHAILTPPIRLWTGSFKMPVDHAFHVQGIGTVVTGTIQRGSVRQGDEVEVQPGGKKARVRFIQMFGEDLKEAWAGDRVGIVVGELRPSDVGRGQILCAPGTLSPAQYVVGDVEIDEGYSHELAPRTSMHVNVGLQMIPAQFTPFREEGETRSVVDDAHAGERCGAVLKLQEASVVERGDRLLLMRIDLPPKSSRVVGSLVVTEMLSAAPTLFRKKLREGVVAEKLDEGRFLVRGLFASASGATRYVGSVVSCGEFDGRIISAYGQDGGALVETGRDLSIGSKVSFVSFRRFEL